MNEEPIRCPKCHSSQISVNKKGFQTGKAIVGGIITGNILVAAAAGGIGMNKLELTCLKCGHKFRADEAYKTTSIEQDKALAEFESHVIPYNEVTAMYRCDCGKKACLPVDRPVCPVCGRRLGDKHKIPQYSEYLYDNTTYSGLFSYRTLIIIVLLIALLVVILI